MTEPLLEIAGLDLELDGRRLLAGIALAIAPGEVHVLVGANASQLCGGRIVCQGTPALVVERYKRRLCSRCDGATCP